MITIPLNTRVPLNVNDLYSDGIHPGPGGNWQTSDPSVVELGEGNYRDDNVGVIWVYGRQPGTATLDATTDEGSASVECVVPVPPPTYVKTQITVAGDPVPL